MNIFFTLCSNNYLAQATVLAASLKEHRPGASFFTILTDKWAESINYAQLPFTTILAETVEPGIDALAEKYNIVELNTCLKPAAIDYFFKNFDCRQVVFLDPDIMVFDDLDDALSGFDEYNVLLTPHIISPIPSDGRTPANNTFLTYGIYNAGFISVRRSEESFKFLQWWKDITYRDGYDRIAEGMFVDQLCLNFAPVFFKGAYIITDPGFNMAPWNLHERYLFVDQDIFKVQGALTLKFFHFSNFRPNIFELPVQFFGRYRLRDRTDLQPIYALYNQKLLEANYFAYKETECYYYEKYIDKKMELINAVVEEKWNRKSWLSRCFYKIVPHALYKRIFNRAEKILSGYPSEGINSKTVIDNLK